MVLLQMFGGNPFGELILGFLVSFLVVAFGSYVGVLMALQSFFEESSWREVVENQSD
ncbi:hypothetical protein [Halorussus ruber]|uniref:hypothetical protein n=1 Tax=Halorussus ruber TaxID=1126238 RepID=UPI00143D796B|nr:hypothetical protein [Halorussus ruber]